MRSAGALACVSKRGRRAAEPLLWPVADDWWGRRFEGLVPPSVLAGRSVADAALHDPCPVNAGAMLMLGAGAQMLDPRACGISDELESLQAVAHALARALESMLDARALRTIGARLNHDITTSLPRLVASLLEVRSWPGFASWRYYDRLEGGALELANHPMTALDFFRTLFQHRFLVWHQGVKARVMGQAIVFKTPVTDCLRQLDHLHHDMPHVILAFCVVATEHLIATHWHLNPTDGARLFRTASRLRLRAQ